MVLRTRQILLCLIASLSLLFAVAPAMAGGPEYGTPAWSTRPITLFEGPGGAYQAVGAIGGREALTVYRCSERWCIVAKGNQRGWAMLARLDFGLYPDGPFARSPVNPSSGGPAQVCFFEGSNYTGASFCLGHDQNYGDLLLQNLDNRFASVSVDGNITAAVCRDSDFQSYCTRIIRSQPVLNRYLSRQVSSIHTY